MKIVISLDSIQEEEDNPKNEQQEQEQESGDEMIFDYEIMNPWLKRRMSARLLTIC